MASSDGNVPAESDDAKPPTAIPSRPTLLRRRGEELEGACADCIGELEAAADFDAKFLVLDTWLRIFDGEPLPSRAPPPAGEANDSAEATEVKEASEADAPDGKEQPKESALQASDSTACAEPAKKKKKPVVVELQRRFAKYKRLKEALALFTERFGQDAFSCLVPELLRAAAELADGSKAAAELPMPEQPKVAKPVRLRSITSGKTPAPVTAPESEPAAPEEAKATTVTLPAGEVRALLANMVLLNTQGFPDLQKLYLSSAKAAPQKILCLLAYFRRCTGGAEESSRSVVFERCMCEDEVTSFLPTPLKPSESASNEAPVGQASAGDEIPASEATAGEATAGEAAAGEKTADGADAATGTVETAKLTEGEASEESSGEGPGQELPAVSWFSDFAGSLQGSKSAVILLSSQSSFGTIGDVKTPPEEVPLWEMPELLCSRLVLGCLPLSEKQVILVRGALCVNHCVTEGPLLTLAKEAEPAAGVRDIAAMDISRNTDDRRYAVCFLRQDAAKWSTCFRLLGQADHAIVSVTHPPMLGVDKHWAYAMQLLSAGHAAASLGVKLALQYALSSDGYCTGAPAPAELQPAQTKESKHFEALTSRMSSCGWRFRDILRLTALFPLARSASTEKFHAFWTRRLRDKSLPGAGRPSKQELGHIRSRQEELWPPPPPPPPAPPEKEEPALPAEHATGETSAPEKSTAASASGAKAPCEKSKEVSSEPSGAHSRSRRSCSRSRGRKGRSQDKSRRSRSRNRRSRNRSRRR
eukprot:TRINITY_DN30295_c0_g1_i1.p1 TRINITY_DN30295_c0_g1~~TRINITY_DN30295_c0_g1_i1.p1  ORF type:complete len:760 (+),score=200.42 TRINITY_DN30295_c0_g1_i1:24-2303(+)